MEEPEAQEPERETKPTPPTGPRWKRWLANLGLLVGGCLVALVVAEFGCRAMYYFPQPQFLQLDDIVGHRLRAKIRGYYVEEGFSHFSTNSHHMRDREFSVQKPPGVFRIAVLGDSYAEALQVELEQTFCKRLESQLKQVEVLNFGVSGYGTAQEYLTYLNFVRPFSPNLVILAVSPGNDISDNSRALSGGYPRPYYTLKDSRLERDNGFRQSRRHRLLRRWGPLYYFVTNHSALAETLDRWRRRVSTRQRQLSPEQNAATSPTVEAGLSQGVYGPPATPDWRAAWAVTERLILELQRAVPEDGASLAIMTATTGGQVDAQMREQAAREHPDWNMEYADRRLGQFAESQGIPALVLVPQFLDYNRRTGVKLHGFANASRGHWNAQGHRLAAELLRRFLADRGLVPPEYLK